LQQLWIQDTQVTGRVCWICRTRCRTAKFMPASALILGDSFPPSIPDESQSLAAG